MQGAMMNGMWLTPGRWIFLFILLTLFGLRNGRAEGNGGFAGSYLRMGLGARALSMGNTQVATAVNGFAGFYNPGALTNLKNSVFSLSYSFMSLDRRFNYLSYAMPLKPLAGFSVGWIYSGVGDIRAYNSRGEDLGAIDHGLHALYFSFGINLTPVFQPKRRDPALIKDIISVGVSMKILRESFDDNESFNYTGKGFGFDVGVFLKPHRKLQLGYQLKDVNSKLKSNTNDLFERGSTLENKFPLIQKAGLFYRTPLRNVGVAYDFEWSTKGQEEHHLGVEWAGPGLAFRAGYDQNHLTFGGGLDFRVLKQIYLILDYAFVDDVYDEGVSHVFSWQFIF